MVNVGDKQHDATRDRVGQGATWNVSTVVSHPPVKKLAADVPE